MSKPIIEIRNLRKRYQIGAERQPYLTLRDQIAQRARRSRNGHNTDFWALKDISFDVQPGESVGIIGRNGAGKSTLLKILSQITPPTEGCIKMRGRVASLLEVGTGFHAELTGRENVYLNGAILGMTRSEVQRKFDEIVAFAEVDTFLDTPVKRYSSGMYVRLAFAVAAHLEPEILVVDEVLAVGDAEFQKKCLGKMGDVARAGRTVLFVSHNMAAVQALCGRAVLLRQGEIVMFDAVAPTLKRYLAVESESTGVREWRTLETAPGDDVARLTAVRLRNGRGELAARFTVRESFDVEIEYQILKPGYPINTMCYFLDDYGGTKFVSVDNLDSPWARTSRPQGLYRSTCHVPADFMNEGISRLHVLVTTSPAGLHACEHDVLTFEIVDDMDPAGVRGNYPREWPPASVRPRLHWDVDLAGSSAGSRL